MHLFLWPEPALLSPDLGLPRLAPFIGFPHVTILSPPRHRKGSCWRYFGWSTTAVLSFLDPSLQCVREATVFGQELLSKRFQNLQVLHRRKIREQRFTASARQLGNDTLTRSILEKTHELRWGWVNTWETAKGVEPYHHTQLTGQLDILSLLKKGGSNSGWGWMSLASWHQFYMKLAAFWRMTSLYFHLKKGK